MFFVLQSEHSPMHKYCELDDSGVAHAFWLFRNDGWVVATRLVDGVIQCACDSSRHVAVECFPAYVILKVNLKESELEHPVSMAETDERLQALRCSGVVSTRADDDLDDADVLIVNERNRGL